MTQVFICRELKVSSSFFNYKTLRALPYAAFAEDRAVGQYACHVFKKVKSLATAVFWDYKYLSS